MRIIGDDVICEQRERLSEHEQRVLFGLAEGETPTKIKEALNCDTMSLCNLEINLMRKLGAKTKTHIVSRGFVLGLLFSRALCLMLAIALSNFGDFTDDWARLARNTRTTRTTRINRTATRIRTKDA